MSRPANFLGLPSEWSHPHQSKIIILPIPYERTTSYKKGTRQGPGEIIAASQYLELFDEELHIEPYRECGGIATLSALRIAPGATGKEAVDIIYKKALGLIRDGKFVISIGGEHTISIGAARAYSESFSPLSVLHLDAHADMRESYQNDSYSHACVMARIYEFHRDIVHMGIRSLSTEEAETIRKENLHFFLVTDIRRGLWGDSPEKWQNSVIERLSQNVYVTFDCDFLDPSLMPSVGTPEPGGFGWDETLSFLRRLASSRNIVGFDINELLPMKPFVHPQFTIAKLIYKLIGYLVSR